MMSLKNRAVLLFILGVLLSRQINSASGSNNSSSNHSTDNGDHENRPGHEDPPPLKVAKFDFEHVQGPLIIILWVLIASLAKLGKLNYNYYRA